MENLKHILKKVVGDVKYQGAETVPKTARHDARVIQIMMSSNNPNLKDFVPLTRLP
jgi:hypothetical protein